MNDCYVILGVQPSASAAEIKRAFRQRAKELHPDLQKTPDAIRESEEMMRALLLAYETLSDPASRAEFDSVYVKFRQYTDGTDRESSFDYRMWLMARSDDESRAKLIFFDLLHNLEEEAVLEYQNRKKESVRFNLSRYFDREDFMDCAFILAEELVFRSQIYDGFHLLLEVCALEAEKPYFRHFFPEVIQFVRDIIKGKIAGSMSDELALDCLESALELRLGKKDDAAILKQMALCYERMGDVRTAKICMEEALERDPKIYGLVELKKRLERHGA